MHPPSTARASGLLLSVVLLAAGVRGSFAADPVPPGVPVPRFTAKDVALTEAGLPEGWKLAPTDAPPAEDKALREGIAAVATESKEPDVVPVTIALLTPDGKPVVVALVETLRDPSAFAAAAKATAAKNGWSFRDLGTPARVVLVAGPEDARAAALAAQVAATVGFLAKRADEELGKWRAGKVRLMNAYVLSQDVLTLDPKHAPSHLIKADSILRMMAQGNEEALPADALSHLRAVTAKDATSPLMGDQLVQANTLLSQALGMVGEELLSREPPKNEQGRDALKEAVERLPGTKVPRDLALRFRYNLACAHGRLKEKDAAFALLTALLEDLAKAPDPQLAQIWRTDPDFSSLREDPRWTELMTKYPEQAAEDVK
jgi:hypothetical protein